MPKPKDDQKLIDAVQQMLDQNWPEDQIMEVVQAYRSLPAEYRAGLQPSQEPQTWAQGVLQGLREGLTMSSTGFRSGLAPGVVEGAKGLAMLPVWLAKEGASAVRGAANLVTNPAETLINAARDVGAIPGKIGGAVKEGVKEAAAHPYSFGRSGGEMAGAAATGIAAGKVIPLTPKPAARVIGRGVQQVAKGGGWPIRMIGAHQLGTGNPMGVVTMALPEMLKSSGQAMERWGTPTGAQAATPQGRLLRIRQDLASRSRNTSDILAELDEAQQDLTARGRTVRTDAEVGELLKEQTTLDTLRREVTAASAKQPQIQVYRKRMREAQQAGRERAGQEASTARAADRMAVQVRKTAERNARAEAGADASAARAADAARRAKEAGLTEPVPSHSTSVSGVNPAGERVTFRETRRAPKADPYAGLSEDERGMVESLRKMGMDEESVGRSLDLYRNRVQTPGGGGAPAAAVPAAAPVAPAAPRSSGPLRPIWMDEAPTLESNMDRLFGSRGPANPPAAPAATPASAPAAPPTQLKLMFDKVKGAFSSKPGEPQMAASHAQAAPAATEAAEAPELVQSINDVEHLRSLWPTVMTPEQVQRVSTLVKGWGSTAPGTDLHALTTPARVFGTGGATYLKSPQILQQLVEALYGPEFEVRMTLPPTP